MYTRLQKLRKKYNLSIQELSNYLEISPELYQAFETGKKEISVQRLSKLAKKYNTSIDYLIGDTDVYIPHKKISS